MTTLNHTDILVGQVYCKVGLLLGLKEGGLHGMTPGFKTKNSRQTLICKLDRAVNDRIQI